MATTSPSPLTAARVISHAATLNGHQSARAPAVANAPATTGMPITAGSVRRAKRPLSESPKNAERCEAPIPNEISRMHSAACQDIWIGRDAPKNRGTPSRKPIAAAPPSSPAAVARRRVIAHSRPSSAIAAPSITRPAAVKPEIRTSAPNIRSLIASPLSIRTSTRPATPHAAASAPNSDAARDAPGSSHTPAAAARKPAPASGDIGARLLVRVAIRRSASQAASIVPATSTTAAAATRRATSVCRPLSPSTVFIDAPQRGIPQFGVRAYGAMSASSVSRVLKRGAQPRSRLAFVVSMTTGTRVALTHWKTIRHQREVGPERRGAHQRARGPAPRASRASAARSPSVIVPSPARL